MAKLDQSVVSWPGKEGHSPSRIDFSERLLYEENVPLCPSRELTTALRPACSESVTLTKFTRLDEAKCYNVEKLAHLGG